LISKSELENLSLALSLTKGTTGIVLRFISPQRTRVDLGVEGSIKSIQNFWKTIKRVPSVKSVCLSKLHRWNGETGEFIFSVIPAKFKDQSKESFQNAKAKIMDYSFIYAGTLLNIAKSSQVKLVRFSLGNFVVGSKGVETFSTIEMHGSSKTLAKALMKISLFSGKEFFSIPRKLLAVPLKNIPANSSDNVKLELEVQQFAPFGKNSFSFPSLNLKAISHLLFYGGLAFNNSSGIAAKKGQINILRLFVLPTSEGAIVGFMDNVDQAESLQAFLKKEPEFFAHSYLKESHDFSSSEQYGATELEINNGQPKYKLEIEFTKEKSP
jgi:hypothetical protein